MFRLQIKEFLDNVCERIKYKPIRVEIREELENHIEEKKEMYIEYGLEEKQAEERAVEQMGNAEEIGKKLDKIHKPRLDWKTVLFVLVLVVIGIIVYYLRQKYYDTSWLGKLSEREKLRIDIINVLNYVKYIGIAFALLILVRFIDYRKLRKYSKMFYVVATAMARNMCDVLYFRCRHFSNIWNWQFI